MEPPPRPRAQPFVDEPRPSLRDQLQHSTVAARAIVPLRFFFGATFLYAGVDKLLDPTFFDASSPASIVAQLAAFTRVSPLSPIIRIVEPFAIPLGLLIALAEIAIGLGAISGLAFRAAAVGGALLSFMFFLTASWTTHPFYYGPDLPYAFGWVVLALSGDGGILVPRAIRELGAFTTDDWPGSIRYGGSYLRRDQQVAIEASPLRRLVLQAGTLGAASLAVASLSVPLRLLRPSRAEDGTALAGDATVPAVNAGGVASPTATVTPTTTAAGAPAASGAPFVAQGLTVASIATVDQHGAARIRVPANAPSSLPAGDPGIIVKLADGSYVAYDATCTHQGCKVGWDAQDGVLLCPCHGAAFDPANHGAVLGGPTNQPLFELPLVVDHQAGTISLRA